MNSKTLTADLKRQAAGLGFVRCGVCPAITSPGVARLDDWLARGYAGEMDYLAARREAYDHPRHVLPGARSLVMLALPYRTATPKPVTAGQGRVSRYAWGPADYHDVIREKLHQLADYLRERSPEAATRGIVDTAPLLERDFAQLAGLGWAGKHTLLLNRSEGSYFFLAALLTDVSLEYDEPFAADHCGTCTACLDACPTNAFPEPYVLDASRCISYLTIEHHSQIPSELRAGIGEWAFGCDVCQEVCPWNRRAPSTEAEEFWPTPANDPLELRSLFELDEATFRKRFRKTPLWRSHRRGLLRNAAIVLGNQQDAAAVPALRRGLHDDESIVRGAAAWALGQIGSETATAALRQRREIETDNEVREEIEAALDG